MFDIITQEYKNEVYVKMPTVWIKNTFYTWYVGYSNPYKPNVLSVGRIDKQWKPRSDAAERGVWSGSPLFSYKITKKYRKIE